MIINYISCTIIHYIVGESICLYRLQAFHTEEISQCHIKDFFKINGKQRIILPKNMNMLNSETKKEK